MTATIVVDRRYDLTVTMYPSFTYPFYVESSGWYVKVVGSFRGLRFRIKDSKILEFRGLPESMVEVVKDLSGVWFNPYDYASRLSRSAVSRVWPLIEAYSGVGLALDPYSRLWVFSSAALSRHTDFHVNTVRWVRRLSEVLHDLHDLTESTAMKISRSFHLRQLYMQVRFYIEEVEPSEDRLDLDRLRVRLQSGPWIGPKTATSYLLFTRREASHMASSDVHFQKLSQKLGLAEWRIPWNPSLCKRYLCRECPSNSKCLHWAARSEYGALAGWIQTVSYIHDKLLCSRRRCGECMVRSICSASKKTV